MGGAGSLFRLNSVSGPVVDYRSSVLNAEPAARTTAIHRHLLDDGIITAKQGGGCISTPMGDADVTQFVSALERAVAKIGR